MAKQSQINTFQDGMRQDVDKLNHPNTAYRYSLNGRLVFNTDGTYAWQTELGNRISFNIAGNGGLDGSEYIPIGYTGQSNLILLYSVSPTTGNSEIGLFILDENDVGSYKTLFNDVNDPNGNLLNLLPTNQIEARFVYENDTCIRAYWVDGIKDDSNVPRTFTFSYDSGIGPKDDVNAYSAGSVSVHSMNSQAEFAMGLIKYVARISGNILTGVYQYTYRLVTVDGYRTPWYPMTRTIFVTSDELDPNDWWNYEMEGSGLVTAKGNRIQVKGIDQRYVEIEVAYIYSQTEDQALEANIFSIVEIDSDNMTFDHVSMDGEPLLLDEIPAFFQGIRRAKTLNIKDSTLYYGNIVEGGFDVNPELILGGVSCDVYLRDMRSDEKGLFPFRAGTQSGGSAVTTPIATGSFLSGTTTKRLHNAAGGDEAYQIATDYINYKGTQVSHLYKGYFRGETYRFGIVFFDKLGYQSFVYHLADVKMPQQTEQTYTANRIKTDGGIAVVPTTPLAEYAWPTNNFGDYTSPPVLDGEDTSLGNYSHLRILGLKFSGIDVTPIANQISGFMIVRVERDKTILAQGLLYPCVRENTISRPMPYPVQQWADFITGGPGDTIIPTSALDNIELINADLFGGATQAPQNTSNYLVRPNLSAFYAPDVDFDGTRVPTVSTQDRLKLVGGCFQDSNKDLVVGAENADINQYFTYGTAADEGRDVVMKMYYSKNLFHFSGTEPYPDYLDEASIVEQHLVGLGGEVLDYAPGLDLNNSAEFDRGVGMGFHPNFNSWVASNRAWGKGQTLFYEHSDFIPNVTASTHSPYYLNTFGSIAPNLGCFICNYTRPNSAPYGGLSRSALERSIFYSTGHFQPVNNLTFTTPGSGVFDEVEVWGGDCVLDYHGFLRMYGRFAPNGYPPNGSVDEPLAYSIGHLFPLESDIHHPMRQAPSEDNPIWPSVAQRPFEEYDSAGTTKWPNGLFVGITAEADDILREEFNINEALLYEETIQFYNPKPIRFKDNFSFPTRWRYTGSKFYGDTVDTWRIFQVNDFDDLNGQYGEVTSSAYIFDQIYSFQESAFGRLRASDRALVESSNQGSLTTGVGGRLDGIDYINTIHGNQHQWSLFSSGKALYWCDVDHRKICRFAQDGFLELSDARQMHQFAKRELLHFEGFDNPAYTSGIAGIFDFENQEAIFSFVRDRTELIDGSDRSIVSEVSIDFTDILINDNDLVTINFQGSPNGLIIPEGHAGVRGINVAKVFYVCCDSTSSGPMQIFTSDTIGQLTPILLLQVGECARFYRNNVNSLWSAEVVLIEDISYKRYNTLKFNELTNSFSGFHSYQSNFFLNVKSNVLSHTIADGGNIWVHNRNGVGWFYGTKTESLLGIISNDSGMLAKAFDVMKMNVNDSVNDVFINILMFTETQFQDLDIFNDTRKGYKEDILRFPLRTFDQRDRMRGKHLEMLMQFSNHEDRMTRLSSSTTEFRLSPSYR
jgi:hypothetical protein